MGALPSEIATLAVRNEAGASAGRRSESLTVVVFSSTWETSATGAPFEGMGDGLAARAPMNAPRQTKTSWIEKRCIIYATQV
jgi:hypothetical protein